jgi:hypothetical protein
MLDLLDPLQSAVCKLSLYRDSLKLSVATGFFYSLQVEGMAKPHTSLITNWHVLSGRNSDTPIKVLHSTDAVPNKIGVRLFLSSKDQKPGQILSQEFLIDLFDQEGGALWMEHPQHGHLVDVAIIKIGSLFDHLHIKAVNVVADTYDMSVGLGDPILVLGYPRGFSHFIDTPIWKHGVIASEPVLEAEGSRSRILIDATTREGMSGSPVLVRGQTHYVSEDGSIKKKVRATRLVGVYASRPIFQSSSSKEEPKSDETVEIGYVYKSGVINEIIVGNQRGPDYGCAP